jgi:hypothetical protein
MTQEIIHRAKIEITILLIVLLINGTVLGLCLLNDIWIGAAICIVMTAFFLAVSAGTSYKITSTDKLVIKSGIHEKFVINIHEIQGIQSTSAVTNASALTRERLRIRCKGRSILVSPRDNKKFLDDLIAINGNILVQL